MTEPHDTLAEWQFCLACLAAEAREGHKLTPEEMVALVDQQRAALDLLEQAQGRARR